MDQRKTFELLLDLNRTDGQQAEQIRQLFEWKQSVEREERIRRSAFIPAAAQVVIALCALAALVISILK